MLVLVLETVRGNLVGPGEETPGEVIRALAAGSPYVESQRDLDRLGALAYRMVQKEGLSPGTFYVLYLPELDWLEKIHHLVHSPFNDYTELYCDVWIHSVTTSGGGETTWSVRETRVHPALELPMLVFLVDRLRRERGAAEERLFFLLEALGGMDLHTLPGRAAVWDIVLRSACVDTDFRAYLARQLEAMPWNLADDVEVAFWQHMARRPTRARVLELMAGKDLGLDRPARWAEGADRLGELLDSYASHPSPRS